MKDEPCNVCGSTDLNLIDGFYYCVECGTQDVNVRETIVEQTYLADGTLALVAGKKFATIVKDGIEMSGEWHKWHAYNFILAGLTEELLNLGAKPSVKMKVLWIWTRYIKRFQVKEDLEVKNKTLDGSLHISRLSQSHTDSENSESEDEPKLKKKETKSDKFKKDIKIVTKGLLLAILYLALNLDESNIQLSHLFRFIKEDRLSFLNCTKYVPKEIDTKSIPHWKSFLRCQSDYNCHTIRAYAMTCIKTLDLGIPLVPDLNKIIHHYVKELCLPNNFKDLVYSLMLHHPCDFLDMDRFTRNILVRLPDYEGVAMSYVLVALKMCFGLDGDYEVRLSDVVDKINDDENHLKSHKLGMYSEPTDRLFSFREWTRFLQFRKTVLCKFYLPMARQHSQEADDYVVMEHLEERSVRPIKLRDEVIMDILNKIPYQKDMNHVPKKEFQACLTPMSTYTDILINYVLSDELRLLLSEDFTEYSIKYAIEDLKLLDDVQDAKNLIIGITKSNKIVNPAIKGTFESKQGDSGMVFIRNCENRNWLKTNPPKAEHVTKINENETSDKDSDHGYDSNIENTPVENDEYINSEEDLKLESFEEENENCNIFDDNFENLIDEDKSCVEPIDSNEFTMNNFNNSRVNPSECTSYPASEFDSDNFDKVKLIDELIDVACKKYKIAMPREYVAREPRKRKSKQMKSEADENVPKKRKLINTKVSETQMKINDMITAYYHHIENDELTKVTEQVRNAIETQNNNRVDIFNNTAPHNHTNIDIGNDAIPELSNTNIDQNDNSLSLLNNSEHSDGGKNAVNGTDSSTETNTEYEDLDVYIKKDDPNFDERTHNIEQLYIKFNDDVTFDEFINTTDDQEIDRILTKKIGEIHNGNILTDIVEDVTKNEIDFSDNDEESCDLLEERKLHQERMKSKESFEPVIKYPLKIKEFKYWLRHYSASSIGKNLDMHQKFDNELKEKYPLSFNFVINECASILGCSTYSLYKSMQNLEEVIFAKAKK